MYVKNCKYSIKMNGGAKMSCSTRKPILYTVNHIVFTVSKFGDFKRLTYWRSLILVASLFNVIKEVRAIRGKFGPL